MKNSIALLALVLIAGIALAGCKSSSGGGDSDGGGEACGSACASECGGGSTDMADMMIKMYVDGTQQASPWVALHEVVSTGQLWETTSYYGPDPMVNRWQVTKKVSRSEFIVENDMGMGYIIAYQVDSWAEQGKPNVKKAWIGKPGEKAQEIEIMEWKEGEAGDATDAPGIVLVEEFGGVEMAGETFEGDLIIVKNDGTTTKTWMADNGWFTKLIKMEVDGDTKMELTACEFDEKAEGWLDWSE